MAAVTQRVIPRIQVMVPRQMEAVLLRRGGGSFGNVQCQLSALHRRNDQGVSRTGRDARRYARDARRYARDAFSWYASDALTTILPDALTTILPAARGRTSARDALATLLPARRSGSAKIRSGARASHGPAAITWIVTAGTSRPMPTTLWVDLPTIGGDKRWQAVNACSWDTCSPSCLLVEGLCYQRRNCDVRSSLIGRSTLTRAMIVPTGAPDIAVSQKHSGTKC